MIAWPYFMKVIENINIFFTHKGIELSIINDFICDMQAALSDYLVGAIGKDTQINGDI